MKPLKLLLAGLTMGVLAALGSGGDLAAHEIRPALLDINETQPGSFEVTWKVPVFGGSRLAMTPRFPDSLQRFGPVSTRVLPGAVIEESVYRSDGSGLVGESIVIDGLSVLQIDVLVRVSLADGATHSAILRPAAASFAVSFPITTPGM